MYYTNNIYTHILLKKKKNKTEKKHNNTFKGPVFNYTKSLARKALCLLYLT